MKMKDRLSGRRGVFGWGLLGVMLFALSASASDRPRLFFYQLYDSEAALSETAMGLEGERIEMVGFMAPPLKAESSFFVLTDLPMEVCPFCNDIAFWPTNIIYVTSDQPIPSIPYNRQVRVVGTLDLGEEVDDATGFVSLVRLEDAALVDM